VRVSDKRGVGKALHLIGVKSHPMLYFHFPKLPVPIARLGTP
jgi:hypothetical protein